jgi:putative flippase GtrA
MSSEKGTIAEAGEKIVENRKARLFGKNTIASAFVFGVDIALLWLLVEFVDLSYLPAAALAFLVAMSIHYVISRLWIFTESDRGIASGYFYFLINTGVGLVVTLATFWALINLLDFHYLLARVGASIVAGILVFVLNGVFNFKEI